MADAAPRVLVANRGEIAARILRTLRRMGWPSAAVYSPADAAARHVREADHAEPLPGGYLDIDGLITAARACGAQLVHPGYGFLSENADFARACAEAGLVFVGPPPEAIRLMGDKIQAKRTAAQAGAPVLPGFTEEPGRPFDEDELTAHAHRAGFPLLLKPAAGGGGKGMRRVDSAEELAAAAAAARREARAAFGDAALLAERYLERSRHIEVQILADAHGNVVHLGERECSLQRRHQKIIEEAPSPRLDPHTRAAMGRAAVAAAQACGYVGAGTVEFIVPAESTGTEAGAADPPSGRGGQGVPDFAFLEMNTRLQVEHPVTEAVTTVLGARGLDLVELQLRIALGEVLPFGQDDLGVEGHAAEARIYAEDPARGFLPTGGRVLRLEEPAGEGVRIDSGLSEGEEIGSRYDPLLAKVIAWGPERGAALARLDAALARYTLLGCTTNLAFLRALLQEPDVVSARLDTGLAERLGPAGDPAEDRAALIAAALDRHSSLEPGPGPVERFAVPDAWRPTGPAWTTWRLSGPGTESAAVRVRRLPAAGANEARFEVAPDDTAPGTATARRDPDGRGFAADVDGRTRRYARAATDGDLWLGRQGSTWHFREQPRLASSSGADIAADGVLRSPMPGTVLHVAVRPGEAVQVGQAVAVVEAMKMEHAVTSPVAGTVSRLEAQPGRAVAMDAVLAVIEET